MKGITSAAGMDGGCKTNPEVRGRTSLGVCTLRRSAAVRRSENPESCAEAECFLINITH